MFSMSTFDRGIVSSGSRKIKIRLIVYFESLFDGPDKLILSVRVSFSIKGNRSFLYNFCLTGFCCVLFYIHEEYGIVLNEGFLSRSTS